MKVRDNITGFNRIVLVAFAYNDFESKPVSMGFFDVFNEICALAILIEICCAIVPLFIPSLSIFG
jgi:hypothetical protein